MQIKTQLKKAGIAAAEILLALNEFITEGKSGKDVENFAEDFLNTKYPACNFSCKGYNGFPAALCVSVNENIIHGLPNDIPFNKGDLVKVDLVVDYKGWFADTTRTFIIGDVSDDARRLVETTRKALDQAIAAARPGNTTGDLGHVTQQCVEKEGFSVMRKYCGHGIGRAMHMEPSVPNFGEPGTGEPLYPGLILAIEPMAFMGRPEVETADDGISIKAVDNLLTAHFEDTVVVTEDEPVIITRIDSN